MSETKRANEIALDYIQSELTRTGAAKGDLAKAMNISASALSKILRRQRQIDLGELFLAQRFFQSPSDVEYNLVQSLFPDHEFKKTPREGRRQLTDQQAIAAARRLRSTELGSDGPEFRDIKDPSEIEIFRTEAGPDDDCFVIRPQVIGLKIRPRSIVLARKVAAIYMAGTTASPRYNDGELIMFDMERSPALGEYAMVEGPGTPNERRLCSIGRLVERRETGVSVKLVASGKSMVFSGDGFTAVRRIIPLDELIS